MPGAMRDSQPRFRSGACGVCPSSPMTDGSATDSGATDVSTTVVETTNPTSVTSNDTGFESTTGGNIGLPGACADVCMHWEMCSPGSAGTPEQCRADCLAGVEVPSECAMVAAEQWSCVAALSCEEAQKFINGSPTSCLEEIVATEEACFGSGCGGEIGGGGETCELEQQCNDVTQNYSCDTESNLCTCTENGMPGKQCAADGFCDLDHGEQRAAITACCGWEWTI